HPVPGGVDATVDVDAAGFIILPARVEPPASDLRAIALQLLDRVGMVARGQGEDVERLVVRRVDHLVAGLEARDLLGRALLRFEGPGDALAFPDVDHLDPSQVHVLAADLTEEIRLAIFVAYPEDHPDRRPLGLAEVDPDLVAVRIEVDDVADHVADLQAR